MLDLNKLNPKDLSLEEQRELELLLIQEAEYQKYGTALANFHKSAYPWQKTLVNLSKPKDDGTPEFRIMGAIAGNRTGKSYAICGIIASHLTGIYPQWWRGKRFKKPIKAYYCGYDSKFNRRTPQEYLFGSQNRRITDEIGTGFIPKELIIDEGIVPERAGGIASAQIRHKSGGSSSIEFHSYSMGAEAAQGFSAHVVVVDEQPPDAYFSEIIKRTMVTDQGPGLVYCGFTPLHGITPLIEKLWNLPVDPDKSGKFLVKTGAMIPKDEVYKDEFKGMERWAVVNVGWDGVPHLTQQEMDETLAGTPIYLHEAVKNGVPVGGHGRVYPHDPSVISYDPANTLIRNDWKWLIGVDIGFGTRDPAAGVLACWDEENDIIYITDEFKANVHTEQEMAQKIWGLDKDIPVSWPDDANRKGFAGQGTVVSLLTDLDVNLLPEHFSNPKALRQKGNHKEKQPGFAHINSRFYSSRMKVNKNCHLLLKEMENYQYKDGATTMFVGEHHLCDAMRYAVMSIIQDNGTYRGVNKDPWGNEDYNFDDQWEEYGIYG